MAYVVNHSTMVSGGCKSSGQFSLYSDIREVCNPAEDRKRKGFPMPNHSYLSVSGDKSVSVSSDL